MSDGTGRNKKTTIGRSLLPVLPGLLPGLPQSQRNGVRGLVSPMRGESRNEGFTHRVNQQILFCGLTQAVS
jgi:hypothetical protein